MILVVLGGSKTCFYILVRCLISIKPYNHLNHSETIIAIIVDITTFQPSHNPENGASITKFVANAANPAITNFFISNILFFSELVSLKLNSFTPYHLVYLAIRNKQLLIVSTQILVLLSTSMALLSLAPLIILVLQAQLLALILFLFSYVFEISSFFPSFNH